MSSKKNQPVQTILLGSFLVESGVLVISDPCYEPKVWCRGELSNVCNGPWYASVAKTDEGSWGPRVAALIAYHIACEIPIDDPRWKLTKINVGVDSGQAGIFDKTHYQDDAVAEGQPKRKGIAESDPWYAMCCEQSNSEAGAGVVPYGVVSSSGYGDGSYDCFIVEDAGEVIAVKIDFGLLGNDEDEE